MTSNLMKTEIGGEQTQYEGAATYVEPHKKSGGQLGNAESTTDPSKTDEGAQEHAERGERKAENMRYGQAISEQGVGGMTTGQSGSATQEGFGKVEESTDNAEDGAASRKAAGYGGSKDMDNDVGA